MQTLEQFSPAVEVYSIDEAFLSLSGLPQRNPTAYGHTIRKTVKQWTGIPVSVGIAESKTLAKVANYLAKRSPHAAGVFDLSAETNPQRILSQIPVEKVWGVGPGTTRLLKAHGIETAWDLREADEHWIRKHLGIVGLRTVQELRARSCLPLEQCPPPKQGIMVSRSFGHPVESLAEMQEAVATYTSRAAEKLREVHLAATVLMVFLETNPFTDEPQYNNVSTIELPVATDTSHELIRHALQGIKTIYRAGYRYKKAGVKLAGLVPVSHIQADLFDSQDRGRAKRLMQALDRINDRMGAGTLQYAAAGLNPRWKAKFARRSQAYTTNWKHLPQVQ
jgi:DNA polymerase V